jgi:hypothetical protein
MQRHNSHASAAGPTTYDSVCVIDNRGGATWTSALLIPAVEEDGRADDYPAD